MLQTITLFGKTFFLYGLSNTLAIVAQMILLGFLLKDYKEACTFPYIVDKYLHKESKRKFLFGSIFMYIELVLTLIILTVTAQKAEPIVSMTFLGDTSVNFFTNILTNPIFAFLVFILLKTSPLKFWDINALALSIGLIFFKIACYCDGCCYGIEYGSTFYNYSNERYEIPVQLIEAACAVVMFVVLLIIRKSSKRKNKAGLLYPIFMLMYCGSRFCSEFLRDDYPPILGNLSGYHIQCIIGFVLGLIYLFIVLKFGTRITEYFETKNKAYLEKKLKEYDKKHPPIQHKKHKKRKKH